MFNVKIECIASSSKGNCFIIEAYKTKIMIECGLNINTIAKYINFDFGSFDACLISHSHNDHCKSAFELASRGVEIYADKSVLSKFKKHHRFNEIKKKTFSIGEFTITAFEVDHDVKNYGFMIDSTLSGERIVFIIDTFYSPVTFKDVTHFIIEANHSESILKQNIEKSESNMHLKRLWTSHMSIERTCELLKANDLQDVKEIYLTHLSASNGNGEQFKKQVEELTGKKVIVCGC